MSDWQITRDEQGKATSIIGAGMETKGVLLALVQQADAETAARVRAEMRCSSCRHYAPPGGRREGHCTHGGTDGWLVKPDFGCVLHEQMASGG